MEEDGDGEDLTPFWLQSTTNLNHSDRLHRRVSSVFLSSGLVVFLLLVTAVLFLVFVVPSTLSFSVQNFKPNSVKKSWDSLNILLVLVAVLFGFLSRNKHEDRYSYYEENQSSRNKETEAQKTNPSTPNRWYNYNTIEAQNPNVSTPNHQWYDYSDYQTKMEFRNPILRRNSSSYPDLREIPSTHWAYGDDQRRFFDDVSVDVGRASDPGKLHRRHRSLEEVDHLRAPPETKTVIFDTLVSHSTEAKNFPPSSSPPPSPPAPALSPLEFRDKPKLTHESVVHKKERSRRKVEKELESTNPVSAPKTTPPPPPPPPPPPNQKSSKSERKRGGSTGSSSATKDFLNSLYHKKKKKQRQKSVDNLDLLFHQAQAPLSFQLPPSSPTSPPPPSVFQNLFSSKKHKRKRTITVTVKSPPPVPSIPPPPPSPSPPRRNDALEQKPSSQFAPSTTHEPEKQTKTKSLEKLEEISNSGGESPLHRIPPPPPPPPPFFKKPAWKFVVQGDYVRLDSNTSSRSESPEPDEVDSDITPSAANAGKATASHPSPLFCPSPDVNIKAESFITNFRAKLKLEKIHSMKTRELGLSTLGPNPGPSQI